MTSLIAFEVAFEVADMHTVTASVYSLDSSYFQFNLKIFNISVYKSQILLIDT